MPISKTHKILVLLIIIICVCYCFPVVAYAPSLTEEKIQEYHNQESLQRIEVKQATEQIPIKNTEIQKEWIDVKVTSYDLSVKSCGKRKTHKEYGISRSGFNLRGHTRESAMTIATDPKFIPLGSVVKIEFYQDKYRKYDGIYISRDTGSAVKKNRIDLFLGDFGSEKENKKVTQFGITDAKITIIKNEEEIK